jgi:hypothetical protein
MFPPTPRIRLIPMYSRKEISSVIKISLSVCVYSLLYTLEVKIPAIEAKCVQNTENQFMTKSKVGHANVES